TPPPSPPQSPGGSPGGGSRWESTQYLEIMAEMTKADTDLFTYHADRRKRRMRVGESWWKLLGDMVVMMRANWADVDLLLDPYSLHLPTKQDRVRWYPGSVSQAANLVQPTANIPEPTDLITALFECDQADPWRNHFRDPGSVHPSRNIPRLVNKFNPPAAPPGAPEHLQLPLRLPLRRLRDRRSDFLPSSAAEISDSSTLSFRNFLIQPHLLLVCSVLNRSQVIFLLDRSVFHDHLRQC
ncbi:hypothetical protein PHMEG_00037549, partial [Phytophthora megakarya]